MDDRDRDFVFVDAGRTFTCEVEAPGRSRSETWWWFRVSTEDHQRYAPFRAAADDTRDDVRARVVAFYDNLLARRAEPAASRWQRRPVGPAAPAAAAPPAEDIAAR